MRRGYIRGFVLLNMICISSCSGPAPASAPAAEVPPPAANATRPPPATPSQEGPAGPSAASERDRQCNLLIDAVNTHTPKMTAATEKFGDIATKPEVIREYEDTVQAAIDAVDGLEIDDETVRGFAGRYLALLESAKAVGGAMRAAANDASLLPDVVVKAEGIRTNEEKLVTDVNAYCSPELTEDSLR